MARVTGDSYEVRAILRHLSSEEHAAAVRAQARDLAAGIVANTPCGDCGAAAGVACRGLVDAVHYGRQARYARTGWLIPC